MRVGQRLMEGHPEGTRGQLAKLAGPVLSAGSEDRQACVPPPCSPPSPSVPQTLLRQLGQGQAGHHLPQVSPYPPATGHSAYSSTINPSISGSDPGREHVAHVYIAHGGGSD